jgi:hypothetical protein
MSEVQDFSQLHVLNEDGDLTLNTIIQQDVSQIKKDNWNEAQSSNGFSDGRTMRKVASIGEVEYLTAIQLGYKLDAEDPFFLQQELRRYLRVRGIDQGVQTVRHILTPDGSPNIIVK